MRKIKKKQSHWYRITDGITAPSYITLTQLGLALGLLPNDLMLSDPPVVTEKDIRFPAFTLKDRADLDELIQVLHDITQMGGQAWDPDRPVAQIKEFCKDMRRKLKIIREQTLAEKRPETMPPLSTVAQHENGVKVYEAAPTGNSRRRKESDKTAEEEPKYGKDGQ